MTALRPLGRSVPVVPSDIARTPGSRELAECVRLEWWVGDGGDPAQLLDGFLTEAGLSRPDLAGQPPERGETRRAFSASRKNVEILISAAGCAAIAGGAPETRVEVRGGRVRTRPIQGTRPATAAGRAELLACAKERAEHVMIVDLERNDLARVARTGSVRVDELYAVRRWCDLWQAESTVSAQLAPGTGLPDLLRAVCPGGSVTGAPKLAALDLIADLE